MQKRQQCKFAAPAVCALGGIVITRLTNDVLLITLMLLPDQTNDTLLFSLFRLSILTMFLIFDIKISCSIFFYIKMFSSTYFFFYRLLVAFFFSPLLYSFMSYVSYIASRSDKLKRESHCKQSFLIFFFYEPVFGEGHRLEKVTFKEGLANKQPRGRRFSIKFVPPCLVVVRHKNCR